MNRRILFLLLLVLAFHLPPASARDAESDAAASLRIKQNIPDQLVPAGVIIRIDLRRTDGMSEKRATIKDQETIGLICSALRENILHDRYKIGLQFHSPSQTLEMKFIRKNKPPLRLIYVGASMYWISWNQDMVKKHSDINFQSEQFDAVVLRIADIERLLSR